MSEVSNKSLATLLIATIVISLGGTLISLNKLSGMGQITGLAGTNITTSEGTIIFSYLSFLAINLTDNEIRFGALSINDSLEGDAYCNSSYEASTRVYNFVNVSSASPACFDAGDEMQLSNVGSYAVNVTIVGDGGVDSIVCGAGANVTCNSSSYLKLYTEDDNSACDDDMVGWDVNTTAQAFCNNFQPATRVNMSAFLNIYQYAQGGPDSNVVVTFTAIEAS